MPQKTLAACVWGAEAVSVQPCSRWQRLLALFVVNLEILSPNKAPKFDWRLYAGIPWLGEPTLWGMETMESSQIPDYSLDHAGDWRNKCRFLACFLRIGGLIIKYWVRIQLLIPDKRVDFVDLIGNNEAMLSFSRVIMAAYSGEKVWDSMLFDVLRMRLQQFPIDPLLKPYGCKRSTADRRLYAAQNIENVDELPRRLSRWMILSWVVDLLPDTKQFKLAFDPSKGRSLKLFKPFWEPLGESIYKAAIKNSPDWLSLDDAQIPEMDSDQAWSDIYRDSLDPYQHLVNGRSSAINASVLQAYEYTIRTMAHDFNQEYRTVEDLICLRGSCRILSFVAQIISVKMSQDQRLTVLNPTPDVHSKLYRWLEAGFMKNIGY